MKDFRGLGDLIAFITKKTGIKRFVDWFSGVIGVDCGCDKRQEKMNVKLPFNNGKIKNV
jgi:hypothetical protein|tara:strand:- start:367 stop:543 length:177 start_codon:yes stop_codon:yes gene_type:complete